MSKSLVFGCMSLLCGLALFAGSNAEAQLVRTVQGADAAAIQGTVDMFRADLGAVNANGPCSGPCTPGVGRREINWDGVGDGVSDPNIFPGDFFNQNSLSPAGRVRGIQFSSAGTFRTSADSDSDGDGNPGPRAALFEDLGAGNGADFAAFSAERIFGIVGSNEMDVTFSEPGSPGIASLVKGFGAVFTDVEVAGAARLDFYDVNNVLLHSEAVQPFPFTGGDSGKSFSFVGVSFDSPVVSRVHIVNGGFDLTLAPFDVNGQVVDDSVAMDDFIYGEPVAVPEPASLLPALIAGAGMLVRRRRRVRVGAQPLSNRRAHRSIGRRRYLEVDFQEVGNSFQTASVTGTVSFFSKTGKIGAVPGGFDERPTEDIDDSLWPC